MRLMTRPSARAVLITDRSALRALHAPWCDLLGSSTADTIFLTPEWTEAWLDAYGEGDGLRTVAVYRGETLIGLAPLALRRARRREWPLRRRLTFAADGSADSDHLDIIARRGDEAAVVETVMAQIEAVRDPWQALALNEVPEGSPTFAALDAWLASRGWWQEGHVVPCARIDLPDSWAGYLKQLKPRMRTKVRSLLKAADGDPALVFDRCADATDLPARLESLYALHHSRWALRGEAGIFTDPAKRAFYARMAPVFLERGWLRFYSLRVGGRDIAHQFCFERDGVMSLLQEGFDADWAAHGVGNTLRALVLRDCIDRGVAVYDFLAGVTPHKLSWGARETHNHRLLAAPPGARPTGYAVSRRGWHWAKRHGRALRNRVSGSTGSD
jgi:CelD/BcsL family acetyltransferase involved in cellulose biosynthesis